MPAPKRRSAAQKGNENASKEKSPPAEGHSPGVFVGIGRNAPRGGRAGASRSATSRLSFGRRRGRR
eukprot:4937463-Prymnesium_polylepis.1